MPGTSTPTDSVLAEFLEKKRLLKENVVTSLPERDAPDRLVAERSADFDDFILMLSKICSKVMKKQKVEFKPDEGIRYSADQVEKIDHPYIFFKLLDSHPTKELKPRIRQDAVPAITNDKDEALTGPHEVWGQVFDCTVQFDIFAEGYESVTEVMKKFEDTIFSYTAYFKRNGVKEIRFSQRITDSNLDMYRQKCSIRSLQYALSIEKLFTRFNAKIGDMAIR